MLTPVREVTLSWVSLQFSPVLVSSQAGGQVLQEHHIWPKGAGGKKHPLPEGLRPPSTGEGGARNTAITAQKSQSCTKRTPERETDPAWLQALPSGLQSGARGATGTTFGSSVPPSPGSSNGSAGTARQRTAPDGMSPAC